MTKDEWAEQLRILRRSVKFNDDDLRSATLGAIGSLAREEDSLESIRAVLEGLDEALSES